MMPGATIVEFLDFLSQIDAQVPDGLPVTIKPRP